MARGSASSNFPSRLEKVSWCELKVKGSITELISRLLGRLRLRPDRKRALTRRRRRLTRRSTHPYLKQLCPDPLWTVRTRSQYRTLQCTAEQILDVPVPETMKQLVEMPEMVTQLVEVPNTVSLDRIKQRTLEHISEIPVPRSPRFSHWMECNSVPWRKSSRPLLFHLLERSLRCPVQTQERTRQVTNPLEAENAQNHQGGSAEKEARHQ